jgi:hypothetical protein
MAFASLKRPSKTAIATIAAEQLSSVRPVCVRRTAGSAAINFGKRSGSTLGLGGAGATEGWRALTTGCRGGLG